MKIFAWAFILYAGALFWVARAAEREEIKGIESPHLHNAFRVTSHIYSGGSPDSDAAFAELARLGVKTIVSVDGSKPDVEAARRHGMRYVHLPIGYDAVSPLRTAALTRAVQLTNGAVYVHCHHGRHRGPAAVATLCQSTAGWTTEQAVRWMQRAGTSTNYPGLYRSVLGFRKPRKEDLDAVGELPEVSTTSTLVEYMLALDTEMERLESAMAKSWQEIPGHLDLTPRQSSTLLWEGLRELSRQSGDSRPPGYRELLAAGEAAALKLREQLAATPFDRASTDAALGAVKKSCTDCHRQFRN